MPELSDSASDRPKTILSVKNKGGVSGSHNAMATATVLRLSGASAFTTALIDLDGSTGTAISKMGVRDETGRLKPEQSLTDGVPAFNMFDPEQRPLLFDLVETEDRFLILDGPAASLNMFDKLSENLGARHFVEHNSASGRDLVVMIPVTPNLASLTNVAQAIETFGGAADYVVVRSMRGCSGPDYVLWNEPAFRNKFGNVVSGRSKAMLEEVGGTVLDMPNLNAAVLARAEAMQVPFAEAIHSEHLRTHERLSIGSWLESWTHELDKIREPLGLAAGFMWNVR